MTRVSTPTITGSAMITINIAWPFEPTRLRSEFIDLYLEELNGLRFLKMADSETLEAWIQRFILGWQDRDPRFVLRFGCGHSKARQRSLVRRYSLLQDGPSPETRTPG